MERKYRSQRKAIIVLAIVAVLLIGLIVFFQIKLSGVKADTEKAMETEITDLTKQLEDAQAEYDAAYDGVGYKDYAKQRKDEKKDLESQVKDAKKAAEEAAAAAEETVTEEDAPVEEEAPTEETEEVTEEAPAETTEEAPAEEEEGPAE